MFVTNRILELLSDGSVYHGRDIADALGLIGSQISNPMYRLWKNGLVLRSEEAVPFSFFKHGKWRKGSRHYYVLPRFCPSGTAEIEVEYTKAFTREKVLKNIIVHFISYEKVKKRKKSLNSEDVYDFLKNSTLALRSREVAEHFESSLANAGHILRKLVKDGKTTRRGMWNKRLGKTVPFAFGYLYGVRDEQFETALEKGVFSKMRTAIEKKVDSNSAKGFFTSVATFSQSPYNFDQSVVTYHINRMKDLTTKKISGLVFVYRSGKLNNNQIMMQTKYWEKRVTISALERMNIGMFHERFGQQAIDAQKPTFNHLFWKQKHGGSQKRPHNIVLSNRREIDRVMQMDAKFGNISFQNFVVFEFKYHSKGLTKDIVNDLIDKLRRSYEFGCDTTITEGNVTLKTRAIKFNVAPVIVCPLIRRGGKILGADVIEYARRMGIQVISTWQLAKNLKTSFKKAYETHKKGQEWLQNKKSGS